MTVDLEPGRLKRIDGRRQQSAVLKDASAQGHRGDAGALANASADTLDDVDERRVEPRGDHRDRRCAEEIVDDGTHDVGRAHHDGVRGLVESRGIGAIGRPGERLSSLAC